MTVSEIKRFFQKCAGNDRIAHAYLFTGVAGSHKKETAVFLAKLLNCRAKKNSPCKTCSICRKIGKMAHQDVMLIEPDGPANMIKIDAIHGLRQKNAQTPIEAVFKVFIIAEAQEMNSESANALLKSLEEPQKNSVFILTSSRPHLLPQTVISRCQIMRFPPDGKTIMKKKLISQEELNLVCKDTCSPGIDAAAILKLADKFAERSKTRRDALYILDAMSGFCRDELVSGLEETTKRPAVRRGLFQASLIREAKEMVSKNINLKLLFTALLIKCAGVRSSQFPVHS